MAWKEYKATIAVLVFLGALALTYFLAVEKMIAGIASRRNKLQEMAALQESQRKRLINIPDFKKDFGALEEAEKMIHPFLKKDRAVELIQEVEKLAEDTGNEVVIEVVAPEAPARGGAAKTAATETIMGALPVKDYIQLRMKITGSFFSLLKFLNKIENSNDYLDVTSLQVSRNQEKKEVVAKEVSAKNPFSRSSDEEGGSGVPDEDSQETVSLINVVVYTQN